MQLMTKEIEASLPPLYASDDAGVKIPDLVAQVKYFNPWGSGTWYGMEYDPEEHLFFGLAHIVEAELGYFSLEELERYHGPVGLGIERDLHFTPKKLRDINDPIVKDYVIPFLPAYRSFAILQINHDRDPEDRKFMGFEDLKHFGKLNDINNVTVDLSIYDRIYDNDIPCEGIESTDRYVLEEIFLEYNDDKLRPEKYFGHSVSVSDVVILTDSDGDISYYFCDSIGWKAVKAVGVPHIRTKRPGRE